jgi:hypothetical protein
LFTGEKYTDHIGSYRFRLSRAEVEELHQTFAAIGFFDLEDEYYKHVMDLPTTWVTYQVEGRRKKIKDYYGAPKELKDLEKRIESLVLSKQLKAVK